MNGISRFKSKSNEWNMKFNSKTKINLISIETMRRFNFISLDFQI